jgi:polyhydroxybutyrate depolymerase
MFLTTLFLLVSCCCFGQQTINDTIQSGGVQRNFILYVPANYNPSTPVPLLLNFHGYTSNAYQQMWYGDFRAIADSAGFIIAHPNGTLDFNGTTHFNVGWGASNTDDVGFAEDLIDSIAANYSIDLGRVYSTGMSNGGFMSFHLACNLSNKIAAVASVTGSMSSFTYTNCNPSHPTPVLQIHGTADPTVPYAGSSFGQSIDNVMSYWAAFNNCQLVGDTTALANISTNDGSTVSRIVYDMGDCNASAELLKLQGAGHTWAGSSINLNGTNYDINASVEVWQFLSRYSLSNLNCLTNISTINPPDTPSLKAYPNPSSKNIQIESTATVPSQYSLFTTTGQRIQSGILDQHIELNLADLPAGLYFFKTASSTLKLHKL